MDDAIWDVTVFTKNRERLMKGEVSERLLLSVVEQAQAQRLLNEEGAPHLRMLMDRSPEHERSAVSAATFLVNSAFRSSPLFWQAGPSSASAISPCSPSLLCSPFSRRFCSGGYLADQTTRHRTNECVA
jgi:hypothetical protein